MRCRILHESPGRIRVRVPGHMDLENADAWESYLKTFDGVRDVKIYDRTGDIIVRYSCERELVTDAFARFDPSSYTAPSSGYSTRALNREFEDKLAAAIALQAVKLSLPQGWLTTALTVARSAGFIKKAACSLIKGRLEVSVLDAAAISASMLMGDFSTASSIMFLLGIGDILEEWTKKKSAADLAGALSLGVESAWLVNDGTEVLTPLGRIRPGDLISVRTGSMIPLDGVVESGEAYVNQSYITGESKPVRCMAGRYVYAGTAVEEGSLIIKTAAASGSGRYDRIVNMIEESQKLKSGAEAKASHLADHLTPYSLLGTALTYLITRDVTRAVSILMVDFSCALKLAMPLSVLSAMREAGANNIAVKGGIYMEMMSDAETIVFDKTGTLTKATPSVTDVIPFGGHDASEMLRMAACLEEHYPHSMAKAVTEAAKKLHHEEENHSEVHYVVAHGIVSSINGRKALIGSYHFIFEENVCRVPENEEEKYNEVLNNVSSKLFFALDGELAAVILIDDPVREDAANVIKELHGLGFSRIVMMTGDNQRTAGAVAERLGIDEFYAGVMPEDKADFIRREHEAGRHVIMTGDGVNDTPALSEADVGISISEGAAIARTVADVTISSDDLGKLITFRRLSRRLMERIDDNYHFIIGFNSCLIVLGAMGVLQPSASALLHNMSTIGISLKSMTNLMEEDVSGCTA